MNILAIPCNTQNYGGLRGQKVEYIVIHYTAGKSDTAENNGIYFKNNVVGASAHWFVDENNAVLSVEEHFVAWHCGGAVYKHPACRNSNSIGVELCSVRENGVYRFRPETVERAAKLAALLMDRYELPPERLLRHFDVTGKCCPAPMVGQFAAQWEEFRRKEAAMEQELFNRRMDAYLRARAERAPSDWSAEARAWAESQGLLVGDGSTMRYKSPVTREELAEILYRYHNKEV